MPSSRPASSSSSQKGKARETVPDDADSYTALSLPRKRERRRRESGVQAGLYVRDQQPSPSLFAQDHHHLRTQGEDNAGAPDSDGDQNVLRIPSPFGRPARESEDFVAPLSPEPTLTFREPRLNLAFCLYSSWLARIHHVCNVELEMFYSGSADMFLFCPVHAPDHLLLACSRTGFSRLQRSCAHQLAGKTSHSLITLSRLSTYSSRSDGPAPQRLGGWP
jgi:hypothetical protein